MSMDTLLEPSAREQVYNHLRRCGNPFRNYFARHPDDDVCGRYHVAELYAREREQLLAVVDLYRYDPTMHSEVIPILGNKGSGKTHLLHSIKHGPSQGWQFLVTPGTFQKGSEFAEYILFQIIDTLLGGGKQRGKRPIEFVGEELTRRQLRSALLSLSEPEKLALFPAPAFARWVRRLGIGSSQAEERTQWLIDALNQSGLMSLPQACQEAGLDGQKAYECVAQYLDKTEPRSTAGQMRRRLLQGFVRSALLQDESELAQFLTDGFASMEFQVRPSRLDLVLALLKVLMECFLSLKIPVVVAFDQLEDLLLARRTDDSHKVSEAFFAGIVQLMHQVNGLCFLIFAERGLWNRFVPSLDGYIQDRLNNPVHVPKFGTIKSLRLEVPPVGLVRQVVAARLRPTLEELPEFDQLGPIYPFSDEQVERIARTEPTLRDMLQQFRLLFDRVVYGGNTANSAFEAAVANGWTEEAEKPSTPEVRERPAPNVSEWPPIVKNVTIIETPAAPVSPPSASSAAPSEPASASSQVEAGAQGRPNMFELWKQEIATARAKLEPEGALTGATRELQAGLGTLLQISHEHGVKVGPWRLMHVVPDWSFGEHPTYGMLTIAHWAAKEQAPERFGIGLFLGRGPGKPKDLQVKLSSLTIEPPVVDQLVLLRPADDTTLSGKSKSLWEEAAQAGKVCRMEPLSLDEFAMLYAFPRWLTSLTEALGETTTLPNLADFLQEHVGSLLAQLSFPMVRED